MLSDNSEIEKYINLCHSKSKKHLENSLNSRKWKNLLEFTTVFIGASASLTMPLLAVTGSDAITIAICGNLFVFCSAIIGSLKSMYGFITLDYIHGHLSTEFAEMENEFRTCQRKSVEHVYNEDIEKLIIKFQGINSRSNVQGVKDCHFCCCYS